MPYNQTEVLSHEEDVSHHRISWPMLKGPKTLQFFNLSHIHGDFFLSLCMMGAEHHSYYSECSACFRMPMVGGGNVDKGFWGMGKIFVALKSLHTNPGQLLLHPVPEADREWVFRHLDEGGGHIGVAVQNGAVLLAMCPLEGNEPLGNTGEGILFSFPADETPAQIYAALLNFYDGLAEDNRKRPNYYGNHAF